MPTSNNYPRQENYPNSTYGGIYARADQLAGVNPGRPTRARTATENYPTNYQPPFSYNVEEGLASTGLAATSASSLPPLSSDLSKGYQSPLSGLYDFDTRLDATTNSTSALGSSNGESSKGGSSDGDSSKDKSKDLTGMSRGMSNFQAVTGIGLGLLSFLENRKTSKLQREALRHDIDTAKEHRANRQALGASFSAGLANGLGGGSK